MKKLSLIVIISLFFQSVQLLLAQYKISCSAISSGGIVQNDNVYILNGTLGESAVDKKSTNSSYQNLQGFWNLYYYSTITDVNEVNLLPNEFKLFQNYPNPFNPSTIIKYSVPYRSHVLLKVYNIAGEELITLVNEEKDQGWFELNFNPQSLSSGVYLFRMNAGNFVSTKKMVLIK